MPHLCHPPWFDRPITLIQGYKSWTSHYAVTSPLCPVRYQSAPCCRTPSAYVLPLTWQTTYHMTEQSRNWKEIYGYRCALLGWCWTMRHPVFHRHNYVYVAAVSTVSTAYVQGLIPEQSSVQYQFQAYCGRTQFSVEWVPVGKGPERETNHSHPYSARRTTVMLLSNVSFWWKV